MSNPTDPYVTSARQSDANGLTHSVWLSYLDTQRLQDQSRRLGISQAQLLSEIVGKVLSDNLVDAVLDR
jgi:hypothetical protein